MGQFPSKAESFMKTINLNTDNLGGLLHLYAIPPTSFHRIRKDYVNNLNFLELVRRDDVIDIPVLSNDTYIYNEEKNTGDVGDYWNITIEGVIPRLSLDNHSVIEELERGLWYVVAQDSNGEVHFCGQEDALLILLTARHPASQLPLETVHLSRLLVYRMNPPFFSRILKKKHCK